MKLIATRCALCGSLYDYTVIYKNNFDEFDLNEAVFSARRIPDGIHYQIVRCNKDGLIRSNPVLEESVIRDLYKKSKFTYKEETENLADSYCRALKFVLYDLPKNAMVLEIGCGNGFLIKRLYEIGYKNVFGIEPSIEAVREADEMIRQKIVVDILKPDIFKPHTFDMICFFQVFDHIQDPNEFLKICYDLLLPGGKIVAFNHNIESLEPKILKEKSSVIDIEHTYLYSKATIQKIFEKGALFPIRIYSPTNLISLKYLIWLSPIPKAIKIKLLSLKAGILNLIMRQSIRIKLGNICLIAKKETIPLSELT